MSEQKSSKRPKFPLVLTGNDLLSGEVVWYDGDGWAARLEESYVAVDDAGAAQLEARLAASGREVVEPYLITVAVGPAGEARPNHYREKIRVIGPTYALAEAI
jgi:hypothetical protein